MQVLRPTPVFLLFIAAFWTYAVSLSNLGRLLNVPFVDEMVRIEWRANTKPFCVGCDGSRVEGCLF